MEAMSDATKTSFIVAILFNRHIALFSDDRINRDTVPDGLFVYEVSYDPTYTGEYHYIAKRIRKWFAGTIISNTPISLPLGGTAAIEKFEDMILTYGDMKLDEYMVCCPPHTTRGVRQKKKPCAHS